MLPRHDREFLLDASRLIWRVWKGRLPTGIDRVCFEYVKRFGSRSRAVVQFRGRIFVLSVANSDRLFALLLEGGPGLRRRLIALATSASVAARRLPPGRGMIYLNVGHTGLHDAALPAWISAAGVKAVYLIHDLIPITHPQFCRPTESAKHRARIANALSDARGIIGNSQATLDVLAAFGSKLGLAIPPSIAAWIGGPRLPDVQPRTLERPHFVALGTIEGRKNHILLLNVWRSLAEKMGEKAPILVIIGQRGWEADKTIAMLDGTAEIRRHVREFGRCDDRELAGWLRGARASLMPSFAEGFGLPVIESLGIGIPVIASDLAVYREIVGDIPTYLDPADEQGWRRAISSYLADGPERLRQMEALGGYTMPDWESHFSRIEEWLKRL